MRESKDSFLKIKNNYIKFLKKQEINGQPFYDKTDQLKRFYLPICNLIYKTYKSKEKTLIIGLSGGQGSGKTTISKILKIIFKIKFKLNIVYFSIDDFYKTLKQRKKMSKNIHELFLTRGVPGTHDTYLIKKSFNNLLKKKFKPFYIPKFDKSIDDRCPKYNWRKINKKPEIVIFEGWCVGAKSQNNAQLKKTINVLEKINDNELVWRKKVNSELKNSYKKIFKLIDQMIFLKIPNFKHVYKWRLLQEEKLKQKSRGKKIMSQAQVKKFIMHYERTTRQMLKDLKKTSDVVLTLDKKHRINKLKFN
tara:strand:- start:1422 stop:2339 length:918 start_codon:yes stop_codon:yes gene_type:complete